MNGDIGLKRDVEDELNWQPGVNAAEIGGMVKDGVVTLAGHVNSYGEKLHAEQAVKRVYGVKAVAEEIEVRLPEVSEHTNADIACAVAHGLEWDDFVPHDSVKVMANNGRITLNGEVDHWFERNAAKNAVRHLVGMKRLSNKIQIKPKATTADIKERIESALARNAKLDAKGVTVGIHEGKVILGGRVRSSAERDEAEWLAWMAPGVAEVENHITVT